MSDEFWDKLISGHTSSRVSNSTDRRLAGRAFGEDFESVRGVTDQGRAQGSIPLPVEAGTRVSFRGSLGACLTYENPPAPGSEGVVVSVRTANGDVTSHEGLVFVKWDAGSFTPVHSQHLRNAGGNKTALLQRRVAKSDPTTSQGGIPSDVYQIRVGGLGDLSSFLKVAEGTLVHKSTRDLWSFKKDGDGNLKVLRLFDTKGDPLKG